MSLPGIHFHVEIAIIIKAPSPRFHGRASTAPGARREPPCRPVFLHCPGKLLLPARHLPKGSPAAINEQLRSRPHPPPQHPEPEWPPRGTGQRTGAGHGPAISLEVQSLAQSLFILIVAALLTIFASGGPKSDPPPAPVSESRPAHTPADGVEDERSIAEVKADRTVIWEAADSTSFVGELQKGDRVTVLERDSQWAKVQTEDGRTGYVRSFLLSSPADEPLLSPIVLGYYMHTPTSDRVLRAQADALTAISPWAWQIRPDGTLADDFPLAGTAAALSFAGRKGIATHALVHNVQGGTFDAGLAHRILSSAELRARVIDEIVARAKAWRVTGIHIDFENVPPEARDDLTRFTGELAARLKPEGLQVSMAVPARTKETASAWAQGYDYGALAEHLDFMVVMTYDQHWQGGPPGPVAGIDWVRDVVDYLLEVGVPREKLVLGLAGYGYDWSVHRVGTQWAQAVTYAQAMSRLAEAQRRNPGVQLQWDEKGQVPFFTYDDRIVYFENRDSISHKIQLARERGLAGVALWRLGQEDPGLWPLLRGYSGTATARSSSPTGTAL